MICEEELSSLEEANDVFLRRGLTKLQRRTRYGDNIFFVIDGLSQVPEESSYVREIVLGMIPLGLPGFRFLLSGDLDDLSKDIPQGIQCKSYPLSGFTPGQVSQYFEDVEIDQKSLKIISDTCRSIPGRLETVRRILRTGISIENLLQEWPDKQLFEIEWDRVQSENTKQLTLLAILAHDRKRHYTDVLASIMDLEPETIHELVQDLGFLSITQKGEISFVSEAFREFAAKELRHLREKANNLLVDHLLRDPSSDMAILHLPGYLKQAGRLEDILKYLSIDNFHKLLKSSRSLGPVKKQVQLGLDTAGELKRDGDLVRFGLEKSVMTEAGRTNVWHSEIEARMALDDFDSAITLAQSSVLNEERLHLLAIIAKAQCKKGLLPSPELKEQIQQLYTQIDNANLDDEAAIQIAEDLIYVEPELAIEMVEKATNTDVDSNALDWAFAKLAITASKSSTEQYQTNDTAESIRSRIQDPDLRSFSAAVSLLVGEYPATEVVAWVNKNLDGKDKRLFLLRRWAMENREREDAVVVVRVALNLAIQSTPHSPNAGIFRGIAAPLPFVADPAVAKDLVSDFDAQKGTVERYGPTEDYVRLQLLLARTESRYDFDAASNRLVDIYEYVTRLDNPATKTGCIARMVAGLSEMDPSLKLEEEANTHTLIQKRLVTNTKQLLEATAEHYYVTRTVIKALAKVKPQTALNLALQLNTESRRDLALLELVRSACQAHVDKLDMVSVGEAISAFADIDLRDEALLEVLKRLASISDKHTSLTKSALPLVNSIEGIRDSSEQCKACCLAYSFLMSQDPDKYSGFLSHLLQLLDSAWEVIDVEWHKIDIGFHIVQSLTDVATEVAEEYLRKTEKARQEIILDTKSAALAYCNCIRLAIRAYGGLLPTNLDSDGDMARLNQLITQIPSGGERAKLWSDLALRCFINGRLNQCRQIVVTHVKPALTSISEADEKYRAETMATVAPSLYCAHKQTTLESILELPRHYQDIAYSQICNLILRHRLPSEPYEARDYHVYGVSYEDITDICEILKLMDHDSRIYYFFKSVVDSVAGRQKEFTRQEKASITSRLGEVASKFPKERHIKHHGYKIAAQAQIARIERPRSEEWMDFVESARSITNLADRALVLCMVGVAMPTKERKRQQAVLQEAQTLIEEIPVTLDRIQHYEQFGRMILHIDVTRAKECLKSAMNFAQADKPELYLSQRRIINLAYTINEEFAESLASLSDDDPARLETRAHLDWRLQVLDLRSKIANQMASVEDLRLSSQSDLAEAAWMMLGMLNAREVAPSPISYTRDFVQLAADLPLDRSYPVLAWVIENAKQRLQSQSREHFNLIYEAILRSTELVAELATRSSAKLERIKCQTLHSSEDGSVLIKAGEREKALSELRDWFEHEVQEYLKICDPYFGPDDLEILQILHSVNPGCRVEILTSKIHHIEKVERPWEETYRNHWRFKISSTQDPPKTDIVIVGIESNNKSPVHERWWLTEGKGIRIGTSINSLGMDKDSEISRLTEEETRVREARIDQYLKLRTREHNKERLEYTLFTL